MQWLDSDIQAFKANIGVYSNRSSAEWYLQAALALLRDRQYPASELQKAESDMRAVMNGMRFADDNLMSQVKESCRRNPATYSRADWMAMDEICSQYPRVYVEVKGTQTVRLLKACEGRNRYLPDDSPYSTKGKILWNLKFPGE